MRIQNHQSPFSYQYMSIKVARDFIFLLAASSYCTLELLLSQSLHTLQISQKDGDLD